MGAGVIWNFMYEVKPLGEAQIGVFNAVVVALGGSPHPWDKWVAIAPWNNLFLILIVIWLQTGFFYGAVFGRIERRSPRVNGSGAGRWGQ
ncbi:MAG: hypothetical protein M5U34_31910 [Chloroflexi bacterium]|nr:hypothetical protein [Chloroflexota bacterium]